MKKHFLAILLAFCMVFTLMPTATFAAVGDKITITVSDGTNTTEGGGVSLEGAVTAALNGAALSTIKTLTITAGEVTAADWEWFKGASASDKKPVLSALTEFTIAPAVTSVADIPVPAVVAMGNSTFPQTIQTVIIPQNIKIGIYAFMQCLKLKTAMFPAATDIGGGGFFWCPLETVDFSGVTNIGGSGFEIGFRGVANFPKATTIGDGAFIRCDGLKSASFPKATKIGAGAFSDCTSLAELKLGETVPTVKKIDAFNNVPNTCKVVLVAADGSSLTESTTPKLSEVAALYDKVADGISGSTDNDGLWYGFKVREPVTPPTCTCVVSAPKFSSGMLEIPAGETSVNIQLNAYGSTLSGDCLVPGHKNATVTYSYEEKEDKNNIASIDNVHNILTVSGVGRVIITATATVNGKTAKKDGEIIVTKAAPADKITITVSDGTTTVSDVGGAGLSDAVTKSNMAVSTIKNLTITKGEVTAADWGSLNVGATALTALTDFTVAQAVTKVADIPGGTGGSTFSTTIKTVTIPQVKSIGSHAFYSCTNLATLKLGVAPPMVANTKVFTNVPTTCRLVLVDANGNPLTENTNPKLSEVAVLYDKVADGIIGSTAYDGLWYGWKIDGRKMVDVTGDASATVALPDPAKTISAVLTAAEKADTTITDVNVTLQVSDKTTVQPDKGLVEGAKPADTTVGAFFDIKLQKTITNSSGTTTTDVTVTENNKPIELTIGIPVGMQGGSNYAVIRVHGNSGVALPTTQTGNDLTFETNKFSTYAIAYKAGSITPPPSGGGGGGGSSTTLTYSNTVNKTENGTVTIAPTSLSKGQTATITTKPADGYVVDQVLVKDAGGKTVPITEKSANSYTFVQPAGKVTVQVTYKKAVTDNRQSFNDVQKNDWYYDAVMGATAKGWFSGISATTFSPNAPTSRGMIATILHRMDGTPKAKAASFGDVASDSYYANGVAWAEKNSIVGGYGDGNYGPNNSITREQLASILYRYAKYKSYDLSKTAVISSFTDASGVSGYANEAMSWAVGSGLLSGRGNNTLAPKAIATRAEVAVILTRFEELFKK